MRMNVVFVALLCHCNIHTISSITSALTPNFVVVVPFFSDGQNGLKRIPYRNRRQRCHSFPVAGLRRWISQNFPFRNDRNGESDEFKRPLYDSATQNRWKNAINQLGIGTGLTEEEKAEAARIRRARLVAQDPLYTQRLMGIPSSGVVQTQQQVSTVLNKHIQIVQFSVHEYNITKKFGFRVERRDCKKECRKRRSFCSSNCRAKQSRLHQHCRKELGGKFKRYDSGC